MERHTQIEERNRLKGEVFLLRFNSLRSFVQLQFGVHEGMDTQPKPYSNVLLALTSKRKRFMDFELVHRF